MRSRRRWRSPSDAGEVVTDEAVGARKAEGFFEIGDEAKAVALSGGEQQRAAIAKSLVQERKEERHGQLVRPGPRARDP
ncbi:hypothetical protein DFR50_14711 [Roseiarcus fermentans]|uniref:ABC transporter family protein n=1 Tax=Roseiarcus fermentans TaxID=1473586 RepID=A0A366EMV6_9HYPH|nr:hypothetical protein [Roseiarcus fermentans]RBP03040.1 hypothetical protein DFR50_14711 [Roseiarcus fermentans]